MTPIPADQALQLWGLRQYGRMRTGYPRIKFGGNAGEDYAESVMRAVDRFFESDAVYRIRYRALAQWVYGEGEPAEDFVWRQPGETRTHALLRLGWMEWFAASTPEPAHMVGHFLDTFEGWWQTNGIGPHLLPPTRVDSDGEPDRLQILDSGEAAARLGKTVGAVNMMLERGSLSGFKVRGRWRTTDQAIRTYLGSKRP